MMPEFSQPAGLSVLLVLLMDGTKQPHTIRNHGENHHRSTHNHGKDDDGPKGQQIIESVEECAHMHPQAGGSAYRPDSSLLYPSWYCSDNGHRLKLCNSLS